MSYPESYTIALNIDFTVWLMHTKHFTHDQARYQKFFKIVRSMAFYWEVYINVCKILINKLRITFILDLLKLLSCQIASLFQGIHHSWFSWFCRHLGNVGLIFSWCFGKFWKSLWFLFIFSPTTEKSHITFKSLDTFILM